ncbi:MAG TPA: efflux RND transporter permease subunit [Hyphomicrobiaceae bacterium]|nr:efflux RND transporter permease subunit [Hyphomicrobiaceae bacterium]
MNFNVSAWSIRNPVPSIVLFLVLSVLGVMSFKQLPITRFPNIDVPIVQVRVYQSGAAPVELESQVTKKIEDAVASVNGLKHITSTVTEGASVSTIEFRLEVDADRALNDVKDAIARVRSELPRTVEEPIVSRLDIEGLPIVTYAARAPGMTPEQVSWFVDDVVIRELQGVKGVGAIERVGGVEREIRISLDPDRLASYGITAGDVNRVIRATNVDLAGGRGEIAGREQAIRTLAGKASVEALAETMIPLPRGRKVRLDELGTITDTYVEPRTFATYNTQPVVAFSITRAKGASDTVVSEAVQKAVDAIQKKHPEVSLTNIDTTTTAVRGAYDSTMQTLIEGALLAIAVVFLFLRDWRATLITAMALPLSIFPTWWVLDALGFSLNLVSLLAITIATGILVDDAIVEIENIVRHMRQGKSPYRASLDAADEIGLAVMAITLTIIAVFTPVSFMGGIAGQYFKQFGLTVAISVFFSLLVARLITPMLAAYFLRDAGHEEKETRWLQAYTRLVKWSVAHRFKTVFLGLVIFAGSIGSFFLLPSAFIPPDDSGRALLAIELPPGTKLEDTRKITNGITERIRERPDVKSVFVNGGRLLGSGSEVRKATLVINLVDKKDRKLNQTQISEAIGADLADVPDIRYWFLRDNGQRGFALVVTGRDSEGINRVAAELASQAKRVVDRKGVPMLTNVVSTAELDRPELRVRPKTEIAAELGVTTDAISEAVRIATIGDIGANLAKFNIDERQIPIRVQLEADARASYATLANLKVATSSGASVPLSSVADLELSQGATSIERYDRQRRVVIGGDLVGTTPLGQAVEAVLAQPAAKNLPAGVEIRQFGDAEIMGEVFQGFATAMGAGIMMVYAVLVLLFGSFLQPITILFSLPLSIGGAIVALAITGQPVSLPVVIGILMLMGIVTKNAILLVDFAVERIAAGMTRAEAIVDAGRKRARPIVMTTIAMVSGMVPAAINAGSGGEFRVPMAIAVIGGLISSTMLSLVFVPAVYSVMDDIAQLFWRIFGRFVGPSDEPQTGHDAVAETRRALVDEPREAPVRRIAAE